MRRAILGRALSLLVPVLWLAIGLPAPALAESDSLALEEIVVTARKREESLQEVGMALSALSGGVEVIHPETFALVAGFNRVHVKWTAGTGTGEFLLSLNGSAAAGLSDLANSTARVDFVRDGAGDFRVMEMELIEPSMYLRMDPDAPESFARAIDAWF